MMKKNGAGATGEFTCYTSILADGKDIAHEQAGCKKREHLSS